MKKTMFTLIVIICQFIVILSLHCTKQKGSVHYQTLSVQRKTDTLFSFYRGHLRAAQSKKFYSPIAGKITFVFPWQNTDKVFPAGTILGRVEHFSTDLKKSKSKYNANLREFALAQKNLMLQEQLYAKGTISFNQLEQSRIEMARKKSMIEESRLEYEPAKLIAPFSGKITNNKVSDGVEVNENQALFDWVNWESFFVAIDVPSWSIKKVGRGKNVLISGDVLSVDISGIVDKIEYAASEDGYTNSLTEARARIILPPHVAATAALVAGGSVTCRMEDTVLVDAVTIPPGFLRFKGRDPYVLRQEIDGAVTEVPVTLGVSSESLVQVLAGLDGNEIIAKE
jgi:multidrug efflux pump subunit AcrA (membrane-fusion protein)